MDKTEVEVYTQEIDESRKVSCSTSPIKDKDGHDYWFFCFYRDGKKTPIGLSEEAIEAMYWLYRHAKNEPSA